MRANMNITQPASQERMNEIRAEMAELGKISKEERDLTRSYGSQLSSLKKDLALVTKQIQFEQSRREELQMVLMREREDAIPAEHLDAIRRREEDIRVIRQEKAAMMEWLQRGVNEAQRITLQVEALKASLDASESNHREVLSDTQRLDQMKHRLELETEESKAKIKRFEEEKVTLEEHAQHQMSLVQVTDDIVNTTEVDCNRMQKDLSQLQTRARDVETIEIAMGCMAASVRRTLHTLETLQQGVTRGEIPDAADDDYDSDMDADDTRLTPVVLSSTKAKIGRCDALLVTLWSTLKRFDIDEKGRSESNSKRHMETMIQKRKELETLTKNMTEQAEAQRKDCEVREPQLRRFLSMREHAVKNIGGELDDDDDAPFNLLRFIEQENTLLKRQLDKVKQENQRLCDKAKAAEDDYAAVKDLKKHYRDLDAQKTMLSHQIRLAEADNKEYKFCFRETIAAGRPPQQRPHWKAIVTNG